MGLILGNFDQSIKRNVRNVCQCLSIGAIELQRSNRTSCGLCLQHVLIGKRRITGPACCIRPDGAIHRILGQQKSALAVLYDELVFDADVQINGCFATTVQDDGVGIRLSPRSILVRRRTCAAASNIGMDAATDQRSPVVRKELDAGEDYRSGHCGSCNKKNPLRRTVAG
ncbi:hypothetical protein CTS44_25786 [Comamonas thiooxydans]|nr:hypothetical protein CTS44_25786 [Comamonas thiooxydans]